MGKGHSKGKAQDEAGSGSTQFVVEFAQGPLLDSLYWTKWYNNQSLGRGSYSFIYYENLLLGAPRLWQLRVHNDS